MILSSLWCVCILLSVFCSLLFQNGNELSSALLQGAASAITVSIGLAGPLSLWSGLGNLMEALGISKMLYQPLKPVLGRLFPSAKADPELAGALSGNVCANLLGLGNAATPLGIRAVKRLQHPTEPHLATDEMCRLVVMNTASVQLLPTTVAAVRAGAGCATPFDILPCVWISSILSVSAGLAAAALLGRVWQNV